MHSFMCRWTLEMYYNRTEVLLILWIFIAHVLFHKPHIHKPFYMNMYFQKPACIEQFLITTNKGEQNIEVLMTCGKWENMKHICLVIGLAELLFLTLYGHSSLLHAHIHFSTPENFPLSQHFESRGCSELPVLSLHIEHGQLVLAGAENSFCIYPPPLRTALAGYSIENICTNTQCVKRTYRCTSKQLYNI